MNKHKKKALQTIKKMGGVPAIDSSKAQRFFKPEEMPALEPTPVGRYRLVQALKNKYGETFRNKPGVKAVLDDFDEQSSIIKNTIKLGTK